MTSNDLIEIRKLFGKLQSAYVYCQRYPQEDNLELWEEKVFPMLDKYYDQLVTLGVPREFSMCLFCFGIDYLTALRAEVKWRRENE